MIVVTLRNAKKDVDKKIEEWRERGRSPDGYRAPGTSYSASLLVPPSQLSTA
jgi:hypothetical protein